MKPPDVSASSRISPTEPPPLTENKSHRVRVRGVTVIDGKARFEVFRVVLERRRRLLSEQMANGFHVQRGLGDTRAYGRPIAVTGKATSGGCLILNRAVEYDLLRLVRAVVGLAFLRSAMRCPAKLDRPVRRR